ncbi:MAG TPA: hypothetical protein PKA58_21070 [Polyangium sp.]|jgi:uncharacterized membrane protein YraQ (UPF0718 family)|nr:hypothetical protein [Polyangium sp.]
MKSALVVFAILSLTLLGFIARENKWSALGNAMGEQAKVLVPMIALAVVIAGCIEVLISPALIASWLGDGSGIRGVATAWLAGICTPGGGPIGLPIAGALANRGASMPAVLTYLTSMSLLSLMRLPMEWGILGSRVTLTRWAATLGLPLFVGIGALTVQRIVK